MAGVERFVGTKTETDGRRRPDLRFMGDGASAQMIAKVITAQISKLSIFFRWCTNEQGKSANDRSGPAARQRLRENE